MDAWNNLMDQLGKGNYLFLTLAVLVGLMVFVAARDRKGRRS
jgi:hypothetical protein